MTLNEIEETLNTLDERHSGLNEDMLITLLRAGGWEDKQIEDAKAVFRGRGNKPALANKKAVTSLPSPQDAPLFIPPAEPNHLLNAHNIIVSETKTISEPQSLVTHTVVTQVVTKEKKKEELPHNLPLRPFETSEHIWPFSRYKDIFYGDEGEEKSEGTKTETTEVKTNYIVSSAPSPEILVKQVVPEKIVEKPVERKIEEPKPFIPQQKNPGYKHGGDEKMILLACSMLLVILLLLGYMYSNGRL